MLLPGAIFEIKIHQNAFEAGAAPRTPLGELTAIPNLPAIVFRVRFNSRQGREESEREIMEGEVKRRTEERSVPLPHFFIYKLTTAQQYKQNSPQHFQVMSARIAITDFQY